MGEFLTGKLLVATPSLVDPNFARTVVLLLAHSEDGAFGIVLNRPRVDVPIADHLPLWSEHVASPAVFFAGGPVEPEAAIGLARRGAQSPPAEGWSEAWDGIGTINLEVSPSTLIEALADVRLFTGYAGWGPGQLEQELESEAWFTVAAEPADAFSTDPSELWRSVLRRQPHPLAMFAYFPQSPRIN